MKVNGQLHTRAALHLGENSLGGCVRPTAGVDCLPRKGTNSNPCHESKKLFEKLCFGIITRVVREDDEVGGTCGRHSENACRVLVVKRGDKSEDLGLD